MSAENFDSAYANVNNNCEQHTQLEKQCKLEDSSYVVPKYGISE